MLSLVLSAMVAGATTSELERARLLMDAAAANMVNVETTRTPEGGPWRYRRVVCPRGGECSIVAETRVRLVHDPDHPDADARGFVRYPAIDVEREKARIRAAIAAYDRATRE